MCDLLAEIAAFDAGWATGYDAAVGRRNFSSPPAGGRLLAAWEAGYADGERYPAEAKRDVIAEYVGRVTSAFRSAG